MRLAAEFTRPTGGTGPRQVLGAVGHRASLLGAAALAGALVAVYAGSAFTVPGGHLGLTLALVAVGGVELAWVLALLRFGARPAVLVPGAVLQLALAAMWVVTRTVGLPGQGVLPVGELDVICLLDELIVAALAVRSLRPRTPRSSLWALGPCQLAVTLAGATLFAWGGGHDHGASASAATRVQFGAAPTRHYYCHLL